MTKQGAQKYEWGIPYKARALCSDGIVRTARKLSEADTYFSIPASVTVRGKSVRGYLTTASTDTGTVMTFRAYEYCKNHALLPEWSDPTLA